MSRIGERLFAAACRSVGTPSRVVETHKRLDLGKQHTSGKECYPCLITLSDILTFAEKEKERLGSAFDADDYIYYLPTSEGPCRFGLYSRFQRLVLDGLPGLSRLRLISPSTLDAYSPEGMIEKGGVLDFKKVGFFSLVVADVMDRLLWRIRPYEKKPGAADDLITGSILLMEETIESYGAKKDFGKILHQLGDIIEQAKKIIDPKIPTKPLVAVAGEVFLRMHVGANQDLIRLLETHGAEVVCASLCEWVNYISYHRLRSAKAAFRMSLRSFRFESAWAWLSEMVSHGTDLFYQQFRQRQVFRKARSHIDLVDDHKIAHLERVLEGNDLFSFDISTETCLSIPSLLKCAREGYSGVVNVYPFTCMPGTTTSAIIRPLMNELGVPYLDATYDASVQPGREAEIRTFMYQVHQLFKRRGRKGVTADKNQKGLNREM